MSRSRDEAESRVSLDNSKFDLSSVEKYLNTASFRRDAEDLRREFALRNRSDTCEMKAKKVLAHFQGVYSAVKEWDDAKTHVEWIYSQFVDCLYFHLSRVASFPGLAEEPEENDRDQVQKAAQMLLDFVRSAPRRTASSMHSISMKTLFPRKSERKRDPSADRVKVPLSKISVFR